MKEELAIKIMNLLPKPVKSWITLRMSIGDIRLTESLDSQQSDDIANLSVFFQDGILLDISHAVVFRTQIRS